MGAAPWVGWCGCRTSAGKPGGRQAARGEPRLVANAYVSLGDDAEGHARRYLSA